jgi:hypothetical protein
MVLSICGKQRNNKEAIRPNGRRNKINDKNKAKKVGSK